MKAPFNQAPVTEIALDAYLDGIENLPCAPMVLVNLIKLFQKPDADVDDIVQLIRRDPVLSAELLRRCNSSFYGSETPSSDVTEAVYRLGFHEVYQTAVLLFGLQAMSARKTATGFPAEELRRHSSIAAIAAGALARELGAPEDVAFTAGLLHDIGKLAMAMAEGGRYVDLIEECQRTGASLSQSEDRAFGFNHSQVGAQLLRRWEVPEEVRVPVLAHTATGDLDSLTILTQGASDLAQHIASERGLVFSATPAGQRLMQLLGLETHQIDGWEHGVLGKLEGLGSLASA
jgi:putative nucleotidyltransferase with HDIG domain